jgi:hypothetical protein
MVMIFGICGADWILSCPVDPEGAGDPVTGRGVGAVPGPEEFAEIEKKMSLSFEASSR